MQLEKTTYFTEPFLDAAAERRFTWDIPELNQFDSHYVFVYGTLKKGYEFHDKIIGRDKQAKFCGVAVTETDKYDMWLAEVQGSRYPIVIESGEKKRKGKVKGELWKVSTKTILRMDVLESNQLVYERVVEDVFVGNQKIKAFIYIGVPKFWRDRVVADNPMIPKLHDKKFHAFHSALANNVKING